MKKIFKPASLLFNLLCLLVFFIVGMYCAGWVGAGEGQGFAGGAIVLGWGVLFAGIALVASFFFTYHVQHKRIVTCNWILAALLLLKRSSRLSQPAIRLISSPRLNPRTRANTGGVTTC
jgi:hypothetical protein